jgi:CHAD domain-containing protein
VTGTPEAAGVDGGREVESKFRVHPPFVLPELADRSPGVARVTGPVRSELRAMYFDTGDLRLAREGITLRHRTGEGRSDGWHLKLPAAEEGPAEETRARYELGQAGDSAQLPARLRRLLTVYLRGAPLGPVATLATDRLTYCLEAEQGAPLAELTDDTVSVLEGPHIAARFREVEVEDRGGGPEVLHTVGLLLRGAGAVGGAFTPKLVRALGPQASRPPDPPPPGQVLAGEAAAVAVRDILRGYVRTVMSRDVAVRRGLPDAVHQMRVAVRRLRSALRTFRPLLDAAWADGLRRELSWLADELGATREAEVLYARLRTALDALPGELVLGRARALVQERVGGELAAATESASAALDGERYLALVDRLVDAAWQPLTNPAAEEPAGPTLASLVEQSWRKARAAAASLLGDPERPDEDWHQARIRVKRARYAAEAATPMFGRQATRFARGLAGVQDVLGEHQDAVVARETVRRLATGPRVGGAGFTLGLLYAAETDARSTARAAFPAAWRQAAAPGRRRWLRA